MKKTLMIMLALVLVIAMSVTGTLAYLTSQTTVVTNTFTVGNVMITLDEAKVTEYGVKDGDTRVQANTYKLIPGHTYVKDPTIYIDKDSEESWLFVRVVNEIAEIEDADNTIAIQMVDNGWTLVGDNIYAYKEKVDANDKVLVFDSFKIKGDADVADFAGKTIKIDAYAVQADTFATAEAALEAAPFPAPKTAA